MFHANVRTVTAMVSTVVAAASAQAGMQYAHVVPDDLKPGDTYHLAFVTAGIRDATSSNIADYNQFVNDQAAQNPALTSTDIGVQWFAIASTATVNARDNAVVGFFSPVYLLNGTTRIADGFSDLWDGALNSPLTLDQFLFTSTFHPWTGSTIGGIASNPLGSASGTTRVGNSNPVNFPSWWIAFDNENNSNLSDLYALSEMLYVIPEPATASLLLIGSAVAWVRRRRRPAGQSPG